MSTKIATPKSGIKELNLKLPVGLKVNLEFVEITGPGNWEVDSSAIQKVEKLSSTRAAWNGCGCGGGNCIC